MDHRSKKNITMMQKAMLISLYSLIALMIIFSIMAIKNVGQEGYNRCIEDKCEIGIEYCTKLREINNCCMGAGGSTKIGQDGNPTCSFG